MRYNLEIIQNVEGMMYNRFFKIKISLSKNCTHSIMYNVTSFFGISETCSAWNGGCQHNCTETPKGPKCNCATDYLLTTDDKTCVGTVFLLSVIIGCVGQRQ